ncbi:MAG: hypothetical protein IPL61_11935 [Myxococcales bacterium]|nr:hypothetical protein [Myxococcales bacterium]
MRPLILLTNDDGIHAPMLTGLADRLAAFADVLVVAPRAAALGGVARDHAAQAGARARAHARALVAVGHPGRLRLRRAPAPGAAAAGHRRLGPQRRLQPRQRRLLLRTVAGAVEGALRGHRGVALSMAPRASTLATALEFAAGLVAAALVDLAPGEVVNVNIPGAGERRYAWTTLGKRRYQNDVTEREDPYGRPYYWIGGGSLGHEDVPGSDCNAIADGLASVTPLQIDWSHRARVATPPFVIAGFDPA